MTGFNVAEGDKLDFSSLYDSEDGITPSEALAYGQITFTDTAEGALVEYHYGDIATQLAILDGWTVATLGDPSALFLV